MSKDLKIRFFIATIESILLYGCESWALSKAQEKSLDGTYTRMLRKALSDASHKNYFIVLRHWLFLT